MKRALKILDEGFIFKFDMKCLKGREKIDHPILDIIFKWVGRLDEQLYFIIPLYIYLIYSLPSYYYIIHIILIVLLSDQICKHLFKDRIRRLRPHKYCTVNLSDSHFLKKFNYISSGEAAMCSSHAANFLAQGLFFYILMPSLGIYILALFALIGVGRWYLGAHWMSDIVVGYAVGIISISLYRIYLLDVLNQLFSSF